MSNPKPTYVSSSGTLGTQPITSKLTEQVSGYATLVYLFFETLISPIVNPASWSDPSARPPPKSSSGAKPSGYGGGGGGGGGGNGGGGGGRGGGSGGGGSGFMSMGDLRGGGTVDGCRATCG
ncbi:uncharacterized protein L201_001546 [Kwoniella dendrophila CBS 6074]|uniref:Translation initiation factor IF-2 n=1 Tax=Kwoniella dendrophila CBS 6074 TaxID=1295534 RepID=A0AAX4JMR1_9TREE